MTRVGGRLRVAAARVRLGLQGSADDANAAASPARVPDEFAADSFSQEGEDMILRLLLEDKDEGFYVNIGAHHPRRYSNTAYFHGKGWRGINVDPDPEAIAIFERERPGDINLNVGVGENEGEFPLTQYEERALSTFDAERVELLAREAPHYKVANVTHARVERLDSILGEHLEESQAIDFLNVDTEGMDIDVLQSNDWRRFRPRVVVVEIDLESVTGLATHPTYGFMVAQHYDCVAKTPRTALFQEMVSSRSR